MQFFDRDDAGKFLGLGIGSLLLALLIGSGRARFDFPPGAPIFLAVLASVTFVLAALAWWSNRR